MVPSVLSTPFPVFICSVFIPLFPTFLSSPFSPLFPVTIPIFLSDHEEPQRSHCACMVEHYHSQRRSKGVRQHSCSQFSTRSCIPCVRGCRYQGNCSLFRSLGQVKKLVFPRVPLFPEFPVLPSSCSSYLFPVFGEIQLHFLCMCYLFMYFTSKLVDLHAFRKYMVPAMKTVPLAEILPDGRHKSQV